MEMAATPEMLAIALKTRPHACCLVPEKRTERTTEGGLEVAGQHDLLAPVVARLGDAGIRVSLFIAPELRQIEAAARLRVSAIEIHVGPWCEALSEGHMREAEAEWLRIVAAVDGGMPRSEAARVFGGGRATVKRYLRLRRETGALAPRPRHGPPPLKTVWAEVGAGSIGSRSSYPSS